MNKTGLAAVKKVVLSVEDDDGAYSLIRYAFAEMSSGLELRRALNGEDALDFLKQTGRFEDAPRPSLILLNMNLPRISGPELLAKMRASDLLQHIPVVVFSSSSLDADRAKCLALGAKQYITKPNSYDDFVNAVRSACTFAQAS